MITTDHVLVETWRLLYHRIGRSAAERFWEGIRLGIAKIEIVGLLDLELPWEIGQNFPDQEFSIIDRTSFAVMQRLGLLEVATFDHHFAVYRFGVDRKRAFTVVG